MPRRQMRKILQSLACVTVLLVPAPVLSRVDPHALCIEAAAAASLQTGVPHSVLVAIATLESGRNNKPWPWTVNFGGEGRWFDNRAEAAASAEQALRDGATNMDIGCFQLNYRWHASAFISLEDMLDPSRNATYAAEYLSRQYSQTGDWALAAAAYHSATPDRARVYQHKFEATYARLASNAEPEALVARTNSFPLLVAGSAGQNGSLFPSTTGGRPLIGAP